MGLLEQIVDETYVTTGKRGGSGRKGLYLSTFAEIMADGAKLTKIEIAKAMLEKIVEIKLPDFDENDEEMVAQARDLARKIKDQVNALVSQSASNSCYSYNDNYPGIVVKDGDQYFIDPDAEYVAPAKADKKSSDELVDEMISEGLETEVEEV